MTSHLRDQRFCILLMQPGFALLEAGSTRSKNTTSILFKNMLDMFAGALVYWGCGYPFAYGRPSNRFIGYGNFFSLNSFVSAENTSSDLGGQDYSYATTTGTIVSGAMAERVRTPAYLLISTVITGFIFPVVSHWVWDENGWLTSTFGLRYLDHAGSAVVHVTGGICALIGAYAVGPRIGRFPEYEEPCIPLRGHSVTLVCLGGFFLFNGFLAFNAASQQDISGRVRKVPWHSPYNTFAMWGYISYLSSAENFGPDIPLTVMNTVISASSGALSALVINSVVTHVMGKATKYSLLTMSSGFLGGLVAVCAGSNQMKTWASLLTGSIGGASVIIWKNLLIKWRIDDPVDAAPVHLGAGLAGVLTAPIWTFMGQQHAGKYMGGIAYSADAIAFKGFAWNVLGTFCIIVWAGGISSIIFFALKWLKFLRVTADQEKKGLDLFYHGEPAYPRTESHNIRTRTN